MSGKKNIQGGIQADSDVYITYDDQQKINKFARLNVKLHCFKTELNVAQNDLKNMEDASDEIDDLLEDDVKIPYYIGEIFIYEDIEKTKGNLEDIKKKKQKEISNLVLKCMDMETTISDLKTQLYAKFGSRINLEADED